MGVVSTAQKNEMLNAAKGTAPTISITHLGLMTAAAAITAITGTASTDVFAKTAHGLSNGDLVLLTELTGGTGLKAGNAGNADELARIYFVITANANDFQLSLTSGGAAVDFTTDVTAVKATKLTEISGGTPAYARKTVTYAAAASGQMNDSSNGTPFDVPASTVNYVSYHSASTAGTLMGVDLVTAEVFAAQGTYTVTDSNLSLMDQP